MSNETEASNAIQEAMDNHDKVTKKESKLEALIRRQKYHYDSAKKLKAQIKLFEANPVIQEYFDLEK